ncbi:PepSY-associated TM helix domain-containing protein [Catalinimonas niigatensis]|uniref:PepSY-associated TM helix domain-containing protein n=1 Tax=Catalinimonas niigatensis TaxID=1397264 RepID=UPI00266676A4|nr:PepSY-associated TM helix domain-containing protein [Catalinimonas niigatensis]WPP50406.1 PepSY-associated TM helix domain-containing protein [Catalinimonas niigatensis]
MTVKKIVGKIHLWLGFASGLVVFIVAITGCLIAFEDEIKSVTRSFRNIEVLSAEQAMLPPTQLSAIAKAALETSDEPKGFVYNEDDKTTSVWFWGFEPEHFYTVHVNPYTGKVIEITNEEIDFFHLMIHGHYYLWLPPNIGQPIVAYGTLIFAIMLLSGLVLWWPKNKKARKQRFTIRWDAKWRRLNYDLHNVMGFYMLSVGLVLALTGMIMGLQWFANTVHFTAGGDGNGEYIMPFSDTTAVQPNEAGIDQLWTRLVQQKPTDGILYISVPQTDADSYYTYINHDAESYHKVDYKHYDRYTLKPLAATGPYEGKYEDADLADTVLRMNYDIHRGAILGLTGKIIAFIASLIIASMPVSGVMIWWGRQKKSKKSLSKKTTKREKVQQEKELAAFR